MARRFENQSCVYCSAGISTSGKGDHVIAGGFFPEHQRTDGFNPIRVPACQMCNNAFARHEQYLISMFSVARDSAHSAAQQVAFGPVTRSLSKPQARGNWRRVAKNAKPVALFSAGGIYVADSVALELDLTACDIVFSKIVKGLYFHHFQERFPTNYDISVFNIDRVICDQQWETMQQITCNGPFELADGIVRYAYSYAESDTAFMMWLFSFYQGLYFRVLTGPPKTVGDLLELGAQVPSLPSGKYILLERGNEYATLCHAAEDMQGNLLPSPNLVKVVPRFLAAFRKIGKYEATN